MTQPQTSALAPLFDKPGHHEPCPWILGGISGRMITTPTGYYGDGFIADVDTKANAHRIVQAVNSHDDLLEALEHAIVDLQDLIKWDGKYPTESIRKDALKNANIAFKLCVAAIAKARGQL